MRRTDLEITSFDEIIDILDRCETVRLGLYGDPYPYIVPLSFGYEIRDGRVSIFVHGAKEGLKHDLISMNNKVCLEADIFHRYASTGHGVTTEYESIIGFGLIEKAGHEDSVRGLDLLMNHCGAEGFSARQCVSLGITTVYKITLERITGKINKTGR